MKSVDREIMQAEEWWKAEEGLVFALLRPLHF